MLQEGLYVRLAANAALTTLIAGRIFAGAAPDDPSQYPCLVYKLVGGASDQTLDTTGVNRQRIELDGQSYSDDGYLEAAKVAAAASVALEGWHDTLADGTGILDAFQLSPGTDYVTEQLRFGNTVEFYVLFTTP